MAYKIFISHVWRAQNLHYLGLIRLLADARYFNFHDLSIPKFRPLDGDYLAVRDDIFRALESADVVLVINTPVITNSDAVQDELKEAERLGLPIISVSPRGRDGVQRQSQCPAMQRVVYRARWTTKSLVEFIREAVRERKKQRPVVDLAHDDYETADVAASTTQLSEAEMAEVMDEDAPGQTVRVLSNNFASLLMRPDRAPIR
jgi:hypothetical protein